MYCDGDKDYLKDCLNSLPKKDCEIVLAYTVKSEVDAVKYLEKSGNITRLVYSYTKWHFANARNAIKDYAQTDWVMFLDADERLVHAQHDGFAGLRKLPKSVGGMYSYNTGVGYVGGGSTHYHQKQTKIFRNIPEHKYFGACHEAVNTSITRNNRVIADSDIIVYHVGYKRVDIDQRSKQQRNITLLLENYKEYAENAEYLPHYYKILNDELTLLNGA